MPWDWANQELAQKGQVEMIDISRSELDHLIDEWILHDRNRRILKRRLLDGCCFEPLAEEFDLSVRQVKDIVYKSEKILFKHIK